AAAAPQAAVGAGASHVLEQAAGRNRIVAGLTAALSIPFVFLLACLIELTGLSLPAQYVGGLQAFLMIDKATTFENCLLVSGVILLAFVLVRVRLWRDLGGFERANYWIAAGVGIISVAAVSKSLMAGIGAAVFTLIGPALALQNWGRWEERELPLL